MVNNGFSMSLKQPYVRRRCHLDFLTWRREVNAKLQWTGWFTLLGVNTAGDLKWKPMIIYHYGNSRAPLKITLNPLHLCSVNGISKPRWQQIYLQHGLWNILSPLLRPTSQEKISFNILLFNDNVPDHPRALMKMYNDINVTFIPANVTSIWSLRIKEYFWLSPLIFKKNISEYYLM